MEAGKKILVAEGHRRIWTNLLTLNGSPYAILDGKLKPLVFIPSRNVYKTTLVALSPKLARWLV